MKITHIPKDKLIKIRYESDGEKGIMRHVINILTEELEEVEVEELKQTG